ncbi:hypothetical protein HOK51_05040 [Candidatus Woesearchaeota archaeon]|mgnify:CR=1 FL=1|nr:hypothetical protein [Candidatus Woesearchaeota archaeon]MBT6519192.1 hypothetical protein [Candidatus Woesearchaeota archaeon]MBT7367650.1 hypothetical protein [Candidatus Woesearchaeota archaeon]
MDLKILKERDTPLLSRKRITAMIDFKGSTPSRAEIRASISKKLGSEKELTIIKHIYPRFGSSKAKVIAHIYSEKEEMNSVEPEYLIKKHKVEAPKEEAPAKAPKPAPEAPKEEAPAEPAPVEPTPEPESKPESEAPVEEPKEAEEKPAEKTE